MLVGLTIFVTAVAGAAAGRHFRHAAAAWAGELTPGGRLSSLSRSPLIDDRDRVLGRTLFHGQPQRPKQLT